MHAQELECEACCTLLPFFPEDWRDIIRDFCRISPDFVTGGDTPRPIPRGSTPIMSPVASSVDEAQAQIHDALALLKANQEYLISHYGVNICETMGEKMQSPTRSLQLDEPSLDLSPSPHPMLDKLTAARAGEGMSRAVVISGTNNHYITKAANKRC